MSLSSSAAPHEPAAANPCAQRVGELKRQARLLRSPSAAQEKRGSGAMSQLLNLSSLHLPVRKGRACLAKANACAQSASGTKPIEHFA
jgi:hypothetical protein